MLVLGWLVSVVLATLPSMVLVFTLCWLPQVCPLLLAVVVSACWSLRWWWLVFCLRVMSPR